MDIISLYKWGTKEEQDMWDSEWEIIQKINIKEDAKSMKSENMLDFMEELRIKYKDIYCDGNKYGIFNIVGEDDLIEYLKEKYGDEFYFYEHSEMRFKFRETN